MRRLLLVFLLLALPLAADEPQYTITPASGPTEGGTTVTIKGVSAGWPYWVYFGAVPAVTTERIDDETLVATSPAHLPGVVDVILFEYDIFVGTGLTFTFEGDIPEATFERVLLPILTPPVRGAFGSEFRTNFEVMNTGDLILEAHGIQQDCTYSCVPMYGQDPIRIFPVHRFEMPTVRNGNPGRFVYLNAADAKYFSASLRVYDTKYSRENFGTELPIVRRSEFYTTRFALLGVPKDAGFRSTLRLYSDAPTTVKVMVDQETSFVTLRAGGNMFDPAYAQFSNFPIGNGFAHVTIEPEADGPAVWGFISVTNNVTQQITTITP